MTETGQTFRATYYDGRTAQPQAADVQAVADGLLVRGPDGATMHWPYDDLQRLDAPADAGLRLALEDRPGARLAIADAEAAARVIAAAPRLGRARGSRAHERRTWKWVVGGVLGLAALAFLAFEVLPRAAAFLPMAWASPMGDTVRNQIARMFDGEDCVSAESQAAFDGLKDRLLAQAPASLTFDPGAVDVRIVKTPAANALAAPGGRILLLGGLLDLAGPDAASGGDMVAGVLAHEIAHARLLHPSQALGRSLGLNFLGQLAGGGMGVDAGFLLARLAYGREAERDADAMAREMLDDAGIGDAGLAAFFERLDARAGGSAGAGGFLSTHPPTAERAAAGPGRQGPIRAFAPADWARLKRECGGDGVE